MSSPASRKRNSMLCRFNLHHKWMRRKNPQGEDYPQCKACGKDLYDVERGDPTVTNVGGESAAACDGADQHPVDRVCSLAR
jgi:hypothetical protein